ncbi:hypothetical protein HYH03_015358 [Edaphochlamys debaryana]|uniref:EF-hand domain-containing protein n=1 Tax=Edaphochlamys debaryana TaxID=47281 RepID=A0A835XU11_9CHLO|nr:hypothetical protein HYH03_015358 [Edaphochlamys debaryana]|eukprot:KAG2485914.1 hypothetical protein HYH03_015358 [Edaphochlamys debaryana]
MVFGLGYWEADGVSCSSCCALLPGNEGKFLKCKAKKSVIRAFYTPSHGGEACTPQQVAFSDELFACTDGTPSPIPKDGWLEYLRREGPTPGHDKDTKEHAEYFCPPCWAGVSTKEEREAVNAACDGRIACYEPDRYTDASEIGIDYRPPHSPYAHQGSKWGDTLRWESAGAACAGMGCGRELPKNAGTWKIGEAGVVCFYTELPAPERLHTAGFHPGGWAAPAVEPRKMFRVLEYVRRLKDDTPPCKYYCVPCWAAEAGEEERAGTTRACRSHGIGVWEHCDDDSSVRAGHAPAPRADSGAGSDCSDLPAPCIDMHTAVGDVVKRAARGVARLGCIVVNIFLPGVGLAVGGAADAAFAAHLRALAGRAPAATLRLYDTSGDGVLSLAEIRAAVRNLQSRSEPESRFMCAMLRFLEQKHIEYRASPEVAKQRLQSDVRTVVEKLVVKDLIRTHGCQRDPLLMWGIVAWYTSQAQVIAAQAAARRNGQAQPHSGNSAAGLEGAGAEGIFAGEMEEVTGLVVDAVTGNAEEVFDMVAAVLDVAL